MNFRLTMLIAICAVPNGMMLAAMWERYHAPIGRSGSSRRRTQRSDPVAIGGKADMPGGCSKRPC
jgi:hypothetical protein